MDVPPPETLPAAQLWTAHLNTLKGFYASEVYVVAATQAEAIENMLEGVRSYVAEQVKDYLTFTTIYCDPDDEEWEEKITAFYDEITAEAQQKLAPVPSGVIVQVRT